MTKELCPCGSGKSFANCCKTVIADLKSANSPEAVMRARYTSHCQKNYQFLVDSTHPDHREGTKIEDIEKWASHVNWTKLEVHSVEQQDDKGKVSFSAHYNIQNMPQELREDAFFIKENDTWFYVDGTVYGHEPYKRESPKVGRNDPCICGSGKKYKKCCG